jgi:hypothetical protein
MSQFFETTPGRPFPEERATKNSKFGGLIRAPVKKTTSYKTMKKNFTLLTAAEEA